MAFSTSTANGEARSFSFGPVKMEIQQFSCLTSDTSGTVTAQRLSRVEDVLFIAGGTLCQTAAPAISGTTVTLAFADPAAACTGYVAKGVNGYVLLLGR